MCVENQMINELAKQKSMVFLREADDSRRMAAGKERKSLMIMAASVFQVFGIGKGSKQ